MWINPNNPSFLQGVGFISAVNWDSTSQPRKEVEKYTSNMPRNFALCMDAIFLSPFCLPSLISSFLSFTFPPLSYNFLPLSSLPLSNIPILSILSRPFPPCSQSHPEHASKEGRSLTPLTIRSYHCLVHCSLFGVFCTVRV